MKRFVAIFLSMLIVLSMFGCSSGGINKANAEKKRLDSIEILRDFIVKNGKNFAGVSVYQHETNIKDTSLMFMVKGDVIVLTFTHELGQMKTEATSSQQSTGLYLTGYKDQKDQMYYAYQNNSVSAGKINMSVTGGYDLDPYSFTSDSKINVIDFKGSKGNETAQITDEYMYSFEDGLNTLLEVFSSTLKDENLKLTLADFGLIKYQIDPNRASSIRDEVWAKDETKPVVKENAKPVEPAPVIINIGKIEINTAGTPEVDLQFENTGDTDIVALDFYIRCYDAYGDLIKGSGRYDAYHGTHQEGIPARGMSASDMYWSLFGFDNTKTIEIAIAKYKLDGKPAVEIPYNQMKWFK